ncbi:MAG: transporter [Oligoflexia bacterium]|nr:transporter [Oligoflexia bacterium]
MFKKIFTFLFLISLISTHAAKSTSHAPIGVMGDHVHKKGEAMLSFRVMHMEMSGMRAGTNSLKDSDYSQMMKPQEMSMRMYMLGGMYGVTDNLTLMPMLGFQSKEMKMKNGMTKVVSEMESSSLSDIKLTGLYKLTEHFIFKLGISIPTGSIEETGTMNGMTNTRLPYPMQNGSGTYDSLWAMTYSAHAGQFNYGAQADYIWRHDYNDQGYRLGNEFSFSSWLAYQVTNWWSPSLRAKYSWRNNIKGRDNNLTIMPTMNPAASTQNQGRNVIDLYFGSNFMITGGALKGNRFAFEVGLPIVQNLHGPQMETDYSVTLGWQKSL